MPLSLMTSPRGIRDSEPGLSFATPVANPLQENKEQEPAGKNADRR